MSKEVIIKCDLLLDREQFDKYTDFLVWLKNDRDKKKNIKSKIMKDQLIEFETAMLAKEKGFDIPCKTYYSKEGKNHSSKQRITHKSLRSGGYLKPTQSLLQKWLREEYDIHVVPIIDPHSQLGLYGYKIYGYDTNEFRCLKTENLHLSYEGAMELGLLNGLELIK